LIQEIGILELEVVYLEQYLLSLYRKRFDQQISPKERRLELASDTIQLKSAVPSNDAISCKEISVVNCSKVISPRNSAVFRLKECNNQLESETVLDSSIHRCHSALSQRTVCSIEASPGNIETKAVVDSYHSLPLSMLEVGIMKTRKLVTSFYFLCSLSNILLPNFISTASSVS